jgi:hypothetical protein
MESSDLTLQQLMFSLIEVWKSSGKTQKEFCQEKDIAYAKFHYWFKKYNEQQVQQGQSSFTQVIVNKNFPSSSLQGIEIIYPDGRRLIFHQSVEASFLRNLLA